MGVKLTCYVPQLESDHPILVPLQHLQGEVHPDGGSVVLGEDAMDVPLDDGGFPHSQLPDDQDLEQELLVHAAVPRTERTSSAEKLYRQQELCVDEAFTSGQRRTN